MKAINAIHTLRSWDKQGKYVFLKHDLAKIFADENSKTFSASLDRLVKKGILQHACYGVYVFSDARSFKGYTLEIVAKNLRRGCYNYLSLESMLSEYGVISQIPIDRLTIMTTGRKGVYYTPYGVIEFTHTKRPIHDVIENSILVDERPLRLATKKAAWRDLKRVNRNLHLVNEEELNIE